MKIVYIKEQEEILNLKQRIKCFFNVIEIEYIDEKVIFTIPINENSKNKKVEWVAAKVNKMLYKDCIENVVLSKKLLENTSLKNKLYENNINILDGRKLFSFLATKVIEKICKNSNLKQEEIEISVLVNEKNDINLDNILETAKNVKRLNIITNHIGRFQNLQDYLYNELGIMIKVSNNKKKDLLQSKIILNIDFPEELINSYKLPNKAIVINLNNIVNINKKKFNGININWFNIIMKDKLKISKFNDEIIYESLIYDKSLNETKQKITEDKIRN